MSVEQGLREVASAIRYYARIERECSEKEVEWGTMATRIPEAAALHAADRVPAFMPASEEAMHMAGRIWQDQDMSHITIDSFYTTRIARIIDEVLEEHAAKEKNEAGDA